MVDRPRVRSPFPSLLYSQSIGGLGVSAPIPDILVVHLYVFGLIWLSGSCTFYIRTTILFYVVLLCTRISWLGGKGF